MKTVKIQPKYLWIHSVALAALVVSSPGYALSPIGQTTYGGTGDQTGTGIAATSSGIYFSGQNGDNGVVGQYTPSLNPTPVWSRNWGGGSDEFSGVAATGNGVYAAGRSYSYTSDTRGDKESKGISVKFNTDGSAGGGIAGAVWSKQTPAAPGGFPYGGGEWLTGISTAKEGGQNYLYTAGIGERVGFTANYGTFISKLDESGNVLWSKNDNTFTNNSGQAAVAATGSGVYLATRSDNSGEHPYLKSYDTNGNLQWAKTSPIIGEYLGVTTANNQIFAVGQTPISFSNTDFLFESYDNAGNQLWSKTYDRNSAEDTLNGVFAYNDHLYAVGSTKGNTAGGKDGIILDIDMLTGNLLDFILWGGTADDLFTDVTMLDSKLYAVGSTKSFGGGGNDIAIVSYSLPQTNDVPEPGSFVLLVAGLLCLLRIRKEIVMKNFHWVTQVSLLMILLLPSWMAEAQLQPLIVQVTSDTDATDHKWPSINNLGQMVWSQKVGTYWQVFKCIPTANNKCDTSNTTQISAGDRNHERPAISDNGTIIWFEDNSGSGIGYQVIRKEPGGSESVIEFSSRNNLNGQHRDAGKDFGISSDSRSISYYTFYGFSTTRRFNVSGIGELKNSSGNRGDFYGFGNPDINKDLDIVYSGDFGRVYKAKVSEVNPGDWRLIQAQIVDNAGSNPRLADRHISGNYEIVYLKAGQVYSKTGVESPKLIDTGNWADVNTGGLIVYEKNKNGVQQVFMYIPIACTDVDDKDGNGTPDNDEDGLCDSWEVDGIDINKDGTVDLPLPSMGANLNHKNIYVEVDYMDCAVAFSTCTNFHANHKPQPGQALRDVGRSRYRGEKPRHRLIN